MRTLFPHQQEALDYCLRTKDPALLMEMRLGKTLVVIRWVQEIEARTVCVLAPSEVLDTWKEELDQENEYYVFAGGKTPRQRDDGTSLVFQCQDRTWLLLNYQSFLAMGERFTRRIRGKERRGHRVPWSAGLPWDVVILDESPWIKNPRSQTSKVVVSGFRRAKHRAILTGLIAPESELDVFQQFLFLHGRFMNSQSYWGFLNKNFERDGYDWIPKLGVARRIREEVRRLSFVKTRKTSGLYTPKSYERISVEMTPDQKKAYEQVRKEYAFQRANGEETSTQWAMIRRLWLKQICGGFLPGNTGRSPVGGSEGGSPSPVAPSPFPGKNPKIQMVLDLLNGNLRGQKVVVFFTFRHELEAVRRELEDGGFRIETVTGSTARDDRILSRRSFQDRGPEGSQILLAMLRCVRFGLDYSAASALLYFSNDESCQTRVQSEDRGVHPSKKESLLIVDLCCRGGVDDKIIDLLRSDKVLSAKSFLKSLDDFILGRKDVTGSKHA